MVYEPSPLPFGSRQAQRVEAPPLTPRDRGQARDDERRGQHAPHGVPPGGTIRPASPWLGSVGVAAAVAPPGSGASAGSGPAGRPAAAGTSARRRQVRIQPVFAVGDLVGPRRCSDERVDTERREVVLAVLDDRRQILDTQLRRLLEALTRRGLDCAADELDGVGEVDRGQNAGDRALRRLVDVHEVLEHRRRDVQDLLDVTAAVVQSRGDRVEPVEGDAETLSVLGDEAAQVVHRAVEALRRIGHFVGRVGQHRGDVGQVRVERGEQITAGGQGGYQQLQVAHRAEDVCAVVTERRNRLGEFDYRVARGVTLAAQVVRGAC